MKWLTSRSFWHSLEMYCNSFDIVSDCFLRLLGSTFLLLLQPTAPQTHRKMLLSSDLFDEKTKTYLMRILQRRARLPTLITFYWDHNTLRAQLRFSYAPSSQPTFDSHSQDCLLSLCVLINGLDSSWVLSVCPRVGRESETALRLFETPASHFAGAWGLQVLGEWICAQQNYRLLLKKN